MTSLSIFNKLLKSEAGHKNDTHIERVEFLTVVDKFKFSILPYLAGVVVFTALNYSEIHRTYQYIWLISAIFFRFLLQFLYNNLHKSLQTENSDFAKIKLSFWLSALLYGFVWGGSVFLFYPITTQIDISSYAILAVCLVAVISNYSLMSLPRVDMFLLFSSSIAIFASARAIYDQVHNSLWIAAGFFIFISAQTFYSTRLRSIYKEQIKLKMQNQELVSSLELNRIKLNENIKLLEDLSLHDELTLLPNRRFLMNKFLNFKLSSSEDASFSLMMLDLDNFKRINDQYGHLIGDKVLIQVANILKNNIRSTDCAARVGGEEFVILLPQIKGREAFATAERIRRAIENQIFLDANNNVFRVTTSIGLTKANLNEDIFSAFQSADEAVYEAKQAGKNCVKIVTNIEFSVPPNIAFSPTSEVSSFLN